MLKWMQDQMWGRRVQRGARLMDKERPGWEEEINLARLDMADSRQCVRGQTYGDYYYSVDDHPLLRRWWMQRIYGFEAWGRVSYQVLNRLWEGEVRERRSMEPEFAQPTFDRRWVKENL